MLKMANNVDLDKTAYKEWQLLQTLIQQLRMANFVDPA